MRIIKRKKGNEEYFYLQHSFRKGKNIITEEKYLGKKIPENIEDIIFEFNKKFRLETYKKLEKIRDNFQKEWKKLPQSIKEKEKEEISIAFTYNTNAIEGSTITLDETREIINNKIAPNKPLKDIKETEEHSKIFLKMLEKKEKIEERLLLNWHKDIFFYSKPDIAGGYRNYLVRVGYYIAPNWKEVEKMMNSLIRFINTTSKNMNIVELAARTHYRFEKIHPFGDGNGRIGRLLMNCILWNSGYPMIIIEYKKRVSYYKALQKDEEEFVKYFLRRYLLVHKKRIK